MRMRKPSSLKFVGVPANQQHASHSISRRCQDENWQRRDTSNSAGQVVHIVTEDSSIQETVGYCTVVLARTRC